MARYVLSTAAALLLALVALLLGGGRQQHVAVLEGNYDFARGDLARAVRHYRGVHGAGSPVVDYNLANALLARGETDAGGEMLARIGADAHPELRRRVAFNIGHLHYRAGRYREAALHFRDALVLGPESVDARINLELALRMMNAERPPPRHQSETEDGGADADVLEQLRTQQTPMLIPAPPGGTGY
jgi:tetratricopeptide (TPR) repeat protein